MRKLLTYSLVITTMIWSVGLLATPLAVGAAVSGDLIKLQCATGADVNDPCKAVYYLGGDGKRYVFPNEKTYKTWYSDFSGVQIVSSTEMSSYTIGGNVTYRPGIKLVKITTDPKVYAVAGNGTLQWVSTGTIAEALYGASFASMIEDIPDAFFVNYTVGSDINAAGDYDKEAQTSAAPNINDDKNIIGGGTSVSTGTSLTVSLAADTPASGIVVGNSINNKFTKINLTASSDGDIIIDQIVVERGGVVASDSPFSSLAIIDAATMKRIGNTKTLNSQHKSVFNNDITVAAGTTKSLYLVGNMGATALYAGEIPSLDLSSITLTGSAAVIGTLPIVGNYQNINGTITIGTLTLYNGANNPSASTQKIGTTNFLFSGVRLTANSTEDFKLTQINFNQGGTAGDGDVANLDLLIDDVLVGTVSAPDDGDVFFNLSASPVTITKGKNVQIDLRGDIMDGSDRTIRFDISDESDLVAMGQLYGSEVKLACGSGCTADADPFWTAPITTVSKGTLKVSPATLVSANIPNDSTQQLLGKFDFEVKGEGVDITSLPMHFLVTTSTGNLGTDSTADLTNVTVYDENGVILAGPDDTTIKYYDVAGVTKTTMLGVTSTDTISLPTGTHTLTIKGDVDADFGANDTIVAHIKPSLMTVKGETTALAITATPSTEQDSATMTVQAAALSVSVSPSPVAQTVVAGTQNHTFANIILGAEASGEDVKVTTVRAAITTGTGVPSDTSNWRIYDGDTELSVTSDPDSQVTTKTTAADSATSTFTFSTPLIIAKGTNKTLTVKGNISNSATDAGTIRVGITSETQITAKGNDSSADATITVSESSGQYMTVTNTGQLTISKDATNPKDGLIPASSSGITMAVFNAFARYEAINVEKIYLRAVAMNGGGLDQIEKVYVYNGSTLLSSVTPTSSDGVDNTVLIDMTNNPIVVPKDATIKLTIKADTTASNYELGSIGASGQGVGFKIGAAGDVTAKGAQSGDTISTKDVTSASSTAQYLFKSVPTVATNDLLPSGSKVAGGTLSAGTIAGKELYAFSVTADSAGDIALHHVMFYISTNTATITEMKITDGTENVAFQPSSALGFLNAAETATDAVTHSAVFAFVNNQTAPSTIGSSNVVPYTVSAGTTKTFTLKGTVECSTAGGSDCSTSSGSGSLNIQMLGDSVVASSSDANITSGIVVNGTNQSDTQAELMINSFLWSDLWRTAILGTSSTTASTTEQWANGTYVALTNGGKMIATSTPVTFSR